MKYKFKWNYKSSYGGPWLKGDVVDLKEDLAEAINRDSPGVLGEAEGSKTKAEGEHPKGVVNKKKNRMVTEAENSRVLKPPAQELIDKSTFKAVKK